MSLFLHDSCTILQDLAHILQEMVQETPNLQVIILAASLAKSCTIFCKICARSCKIVQESCKKLRARAMQVLHARFLHNLARILHDLASSFLLGTFYTLLQDHFYLICYTNFGSGSRGGGGGGKLELYCHEIWFRSDGVIAPLTTAMLLCLIVDPLHAKTVLS